MESGQTGRGVGGGIFPPGPQTPWSFEPVKSKKTLADQNVLDKPSGDHCETSGDQLGPGQWLPPRWMVRVMAEGGGCPAQAQAQPHWEDKAEQNWRASWTRDW